MEPLRLKRRKAIEQKKVKLSSSHREWQRVCLDHIQEGGRYWRKLCKWHKHDRSPWNEHVGELIGHHSSGGGGNGMNHILTYASDKARWKLDKTEGCARARNRLRLNDKFYSRYGLEDMKKLVERGKKPQHSTFSLVPTGNLTRLHTNNDNTVHVTAGSNAASPTVVKEGKKASINTTAAAASLDHIALVVAKQKRISQPRGPISSTGSMLDEDSYKDSNSNTQLGNATTMNNMSGTDVFNVSDTMDNKRTTLDKGLSINSSLGALSMSDNHNGGGTKILGRKLSAMKMNASASALAIVDRDSKRDRDESFDDYNLERNGSMDIDEGLSHAMTISNDAEDGGLSLDEQIVKIRELNSRWGMHERIIALLDEQVCYLSPIHLRLLCYRY